MKTLDFYKVYDYGDNLDPGKKIKLEHSLSFSPEGADLSPFARSGIDDLRALREKSVAAEQAVFEDLKISLMQWEHQAGMTMLLDKAIEYLRTPAIGHTSNRWRHDAANDSDEISNMVYSMTWRVYEHTKYNRETQKMEPVAWYVTWDVGLNTHERQGNYIAGQREKRYTDKAAAAKYIEGRKKAFAHLFTEISPPIPQQYAKHFEVNGLLLPGYTVEGRESEKSDRTADEVLGALAGGDSAPEGKKPSVLGKLNAARIPEGAPTAPGAKRKEDIDR